MQNCVQTRKEHLRSGKFYQVAYIWKHILKYAFMQIHRKLKNDYHGTKLWRICGWDWASIMYRLEKRIIKNGSMANFKKFGPPKSINNFLKSYSESNCMQI